ncbi:MAG TPA: sugar MFS transporter [Terracidiphilus sp.]|nr:sugar MFS transporter [Terracidiphilus sp.]
MPTQEQSSKLTSPGYLAPFIIVTALFFIFGFITTLNMALVPHLRSVFNLSYAWAMLADSAFFLAYFVFSAPSAKLIEWMGYKKTMVVSLFVQVVGCLLFIPAARLISFPLFLAAIFIVGAGITALQTAANPYVAILGPEHSAPIRLTLAQAFNSIGALLAPLVGGALILAASPGAESKAALAGTVIKPYMVIAGALLLLGIGVAFSHLPHIESSQESHLSTESDPIHNRSIWSFRHTVLGAVGIFVYVGVEVGLASIAVNYFNAQGMSSLKTASYLVSLYWGGAMVGRLLGSWMLTKIPAGRLLGIFATAGAVLLIISMLTHGQVAIWTLVLCGFCNSIQFPNVFALGIAGLGPLTSRGSGLINTAIVGGAVIPYFIGALADKVSIQGSFVLPMVCYLYIAWYGLWGSKPVRRIAA